MTAAFSQYPRSGKRIMGCSMKTDRCRYTEWVRQETKQVEARELYEHRADPGENVNLVTNPDYAGELKRMEKMMDGGKQRNRKAEGEC